MSAAARWARLAMLVSEVVPCEVTRRPYPGGCTYLISRCVGYGRGWIVEIHDSWWAKNDEVWCGYRVWVENDESICVREWQGLKTASAAVAAVREAVTLARASTTTKVGR